MPILYVLLAALAAGLLATRLIAPRIAPKRMTAMVLAIERRISGLKTRHARVDGFEIPYLEGGSGEVLLLIHGFGGDKDNFTRLARFLTPHYRVLIPDLPGFGDASRKLDRDYFIDVQVARLRALLEQLGVQRLHIGGNSMGGFISAQFAAMYPDLVDSVWLLGSGGTAASHETALLRHYQATGEMPLLAKKEQDIGLMLAATMHRRPFLPGFVRVALGRRAVADYALHSRIFRQLSESPLLESRYQSIAAPALIVWGAQDQVLSPAGAAAFQALFPDSQVKIMEGIGHLPMLEAPRQTAEDYLAFRRECLANA